MASADDGDPVDPARQHPNFQIFTSITAVLASVLTFWTAFTSFGWVGGLAAIGGIWVLAAFPAVAFAPPGTRRRLIYDKLFQLSSFANAYFALLGVVLILVALLLWLFGLAEARLTDASLPQEKAALRFERVSFAKDYHSIAPTTSSTRHERQRSAQMAWVRHYADALEYESRQRSASEGSSDSENDGGLRYSYRQLIAIESERMEKDYSRFTASIELQATVKIVNALCFLIADRGGPFNAEMQFRHVETLVEQQRENAVHAIPPPPRENESLLFILEVDVSRLAGDVSDLVRSKNLPVH